jgi:hypothetical protein
MFPRRPSVAIGARRRERGRAHRGAIALVACLAVAGCGVVSTSPPAPTPADFQGIANILLRHGLAFAHVVSGDAGCDDPVLTKAAIGLDASGLDQPTATRLYIYIFRNRDSFERLRQTVDACARSYVTDPAAFESIDVSPYVVAGPGPWGAGFKAAIRAAFDEAAGTGD